MALGITKGNTCTDIPLILEPALGSQNPTMTGPQPGLDHNQDNLTGEPFAELAQKLWQLEADMERE
jgi:hypothetical protein